MHRIDTKTAQKDKFGAGKNGFTRGNPQTGTPATDLDDDYFDMLQEELCSVVEASGASLEKARHDQLLTALRALLLSRKNPFGDIKSDGTVKTALENLGLGDALIGDECKIAGFDSSNVNAPYMRFARTNTVVHLATKDYAQPKDQTLTDLSGKDKAELRTYLDLKSAAKRDVGSGANQIPDMNYFTSSLTSPGWQKLPSGLIIQWGTANPSSTGEVYITFPVAFSAYPMYVGFGPQQASLPNVVQSPVISAPTITNLGCGVRNMMIPTAGGVPVASMSSFFWIAVGK